MKRGSLRRSIALPDSIDSVYSPDGLSETDIDALIAQAGAGIDEPELGDPAPVVSFRSDRRASSASAAGGEAA